METAIMTPEIVKQLITNCPMLVALLAQSFFFYKIMMALIKKDGDK